MTRPGERVEEPVVIVRQGAVVTSVPLTRLLYMYRQAEALSVAVAKRAEGAADVAEAVVRAAEQGDASAALSVWLLNDAMTAAEKQKEAAAITVAGAPAGAE